MSDTPHRKPLVAIEREGAANEADLRRTLATYKIAHAPDVRYRWLYRRNPQGRAATWIARSLETGEIVGFTSIFPRAFVIDGAPVVGGVGFDGFVRPDHRRMGVAARLHRASLEAMAEGSVPFRFMCGPPAPANLGALVKIGARVVGRLRTHVRPLTAAGAFAMSHYAGPASGALARAASSADRIVAPATRLVDRILSAGFEARRCQEVTAVFDHLWAGARARGGIIGRRDGAWLRWRYLDNPVCRQELVAIETHGELVGWVALEFAPQGALIVDHLLPTGRLDAVRAIEAVAAYAAARGANRLALRLSLEAHDLWHWRACGFLPGRWIEELQVLCPDPVLRARLGTLADWHFTSGDLNPEATHWSVVTCPDAPFSNADYVEPRTAVTLARAG